MNNDEYAEEYYNCGYDGLYELKEKAIVFECVGRGFKLPPLSQIYVPPFLLKGRSQTENVRPSHHVLELVSPQESSVNETTELHSSRKDLPESRDDVHSESSDRDVYASDEDGSSDECDSHPSGLTNFQVPNFSEKKVSLPLNLVCKAECSSSGNKVVIDEIDLAKNSVNEKDDSATSDDEIYSNPSCDEDSRTDNEEVSAPTNNLNMTVACKVNQNNSTGNLNAAARGSVQNISLDKIANSALPEVSDSFQTTLHCNNDSNPAEKLCSEENACSEIDGRRESSSSNSYGDPVAEMFSSDEDEADFYVNYFRTYNKKGVQLSIDSTEQFPGLPTKQGTNSQVKRQVESLPEGQLKIKNIAKLLLPNPPEVSTDVTSDYSEARYLNLNKPELLVLDNLPHTVYKEYLESFLQQFGKIIHMTLVPFPDKVTAKVQYEDGADLDWVIGCLHGSHVFGTESQALKCYRK